MCKILYHATQILTKKEACNNTGSKIQCHVCNKPGHSTNKCFKLKDLLAGEHSSPVAFLADASSNSPTTFLADSTSMSPKFTQHQWLLESSATQHLTGSTSSMQFVEPYTGTEVVIVGNGTNLPVKHCGSSVVCVNGAPLSLQHILHTPQVPSNLISVQRLCADNDVAIEFSAHSFCAKKKHTQNMLLQGLTRDGPYCLQDASLPTGDGNIFSSIGLSDVPPISYNVTLNHVVWHLRLAHPSSGVIQYTSFSCTKINASPCNVCSLTKSHKQNFHSKHVSASHIFDLIYKNIWTSPVVASTGAKYFLLLIEDYNGYIFLTSIKVGSFYL